MTAEVREFIALLHLPTYATVRRRELEDYATRCGLDALKRQLDLGEKLHRCCWEPAGAAHHPMCRAAKSESA